MLKKLIFSYLQLESRCLYWELYHYKKNNLILWLYLQLFLFHQAFVKLVECLVCSLVSLPSKLYIKRSNKHIK